MKLDNVICVKKICMASPYIKYSENYWENQKITSGKHLFTTTIHLFIPKLFDFR